MDMKKLNLRRGIKIFVYIDPPKSFENTHHHVRLAFAQLSKFGKIDKDLPEIMKYRMFASMYRLQGRIYTDKFLMLISRPNFLYSHTVFGKVSLNNRLGLAPNSLGNPASATGFLFESCCRVETRRM